ncbi:MAG: hypothetical protein IPL35_12770 [Sphingobacteriales bacterium]|nr:hypothetical protein [Sphingobacteriales bacterium]
MNQPHTFEALLEQLPQLLETRQQQLLQLRASLEKLRQTQLPSGSKAQGQQYAAQFAALLHDNLLQLHQQQEQNISNYLALAEAILKQMQDFKTQFDKNWTQSLHIQSASLQERSQKTLLEAAHRFYETQLAALRQHL